MTPAYLTTALTQPAASSNWQTVLEELSRYLYALTSSNTEAFELSHSGKVRQLLQKLEQQHAQYTFELNNFLGSSQNAHKQEAFKRETLQYSWANIRDTFTDQRAEADILKECLRGELITLEHFDKALGQQLPEKARALVQRQRQGVATAVERLSQWIC